VRGLRARGVLTLGKGRRIRFVTHAQVDQASVDAAIGAFAEIRPGRTDRRAHA
jgi:threonine aldolase